MAQTVRKRASKVDATAAVEDYAKAIYSLERAGDGPVSTSALAERLGRDGRLGLRHGQEARRARAGAPRALQGRRADAARAAPGARDHPPPPPARAVPCRGVRHALGPGARRGRQAGTRPVGGAGGVDRAQARRSEGRSPRRSDPDPRRLDRRARDDLAGGAGSRATARASCASATPIPRCCATWPGTRSAPASSSRSIDRQPFGGPLWVRFERRGEVDTLGGGLARAMRVELLGG